MSKEAFMAIRVEPQLRQRFNKAAKAQHRPAAQLIREFMYNYVEHARHKINSAQQFDTNERERCRSDFDAAVASLALEGFDMLASYKTEAERFIRGEIEFDELTAKVHEIGSGPITMWATAKRTNA